MGEKKKRKVVYYQGRSYGCVARSASKPLTYPIHTETSKENRISCWACSCMHATITYWSGSFRPTVAKKGPDRKPKMLTTTPLTMILLTLQKMTWRTRQHTEQTRITGFSPNRCIGSGSSKRPRTIPPKYPVGT